MFVKLLLCILLINIRLLLLPYKYIKKLLPLTAYAPVCPVGNVETGVIISVPSEFTLSFSVPPTLIWNTSPDGDWFFIKVNDEVTAPVNSTEPVICAFVVTIDSNESEPLFFLKNIFLSLFTEKLDI